MTTSHCSAPGSLMLFGEHAVLHNYPAICAAIDQRIKVSIASNNTNELIINSDLGTYQGCIKARLSPPFHFIGQCIELVRPLINAGLTITVNAEFSDRLGFGSSAAVTVATLAALKKITQQPLDKHLLLLQARQIIQDIQGHGSGTDVAASIYGGMVYYDPSHPKVKKINIDLPLVAVYSGYKTSTSEVISIIKQKAQQHPEVYEELYKKIGTCTQKAFNALMLNDANLLKESLKLGQELQTALGVNTPELERITAFLNTLPGIIGAKISGSGLGDCVVGIGTIGQTEATRSFFSRYPCYVLNLAKQGIIVD